MLNLFNFVDKRRLALIALTAALILSACTSSNVESTAAPTASPEIEAEAADNIDLIVVNESEEPICFFYLAAAEQEGWGQDWLGNTNVIPDGERFTISG